MIAICVKFISGKYHATPWGRFPNEGIQEWPPSPYRLLRAIIASWKYNLPELEESQIFSLIQKLASERPIFYLPATSVGHTNHYMPPYKGNRNLIMDTFLLIDRNETVRFIWIKVDLEKEEEIVLKKILENLHYFGRSESWCDACLESNVTEDVIKKAKCRPYDINTRQNSPNAEIIQVMVPKQDVEMKHLYRTTDSLRNKEKKIYPNGAEMIPYIRDVEPQQYDNVPNKNTEPRNIQVIRYAIGNTVKPLITKTLKVAEITRKAAMSQFGVRNDNRVSATLTGKDENGKKSVGHKHAFYLPTDEDGDGRIDHITIIAENINCGFEKELDALENTKKLWSYSLKDDIKLMFEGYGNIDDFSQVLIFKKAKKWISATPFVLSRHTKYKKINGVIRVIDSVQEQIKKELATRYSDINDVKIKVVHPKEKMNGSHFRPFQFDRFRKNDMPGGGAYNVTLEFEHSIRGPITLGYGCHFGLGMFVPDHD